MPDPTAIQSSAVIESLTAAEMSIAERAAGLSVATLEDPDYPKVDLLAALGWVHAKRSEPTLSFRDYKESRTLKDITEQLQITDEGQPVDDDGDDSAGKSASSSASKPKSKRGSASQRGSRRPSTSS